MADTVFIEKVRQIAAEVCERNGLRLYDLEFISGSKGRGRILRVFIEHQERNVNVDDCAEVSRGLNLLLDVEEEIVPGGAYTLEVSSPGLERPLKERWHFERAIGERITLQVSEPLAPFNPDLPGLEKRRKATGQLLEVDANEIRIQVDSLQLRIPLAIVDKAKVLYSFEEKTR
jgi:ribosome maturation factor RimP